MIKNAQLLAKNKTSGWLCEIDKLHSHIDWFVN